MCTGPPLECRRELAGCEWEFPSVLARDVRLKASDVVETRNASSRHFLLGLGSMREMRPNLPSADHDQATCRLTATLVFDRRASDNSRVVTKYKAPRYICTESCRSIAEDKRDDRNRMMRSS